VAEARSEATNLRLTRPSEAAPTRFFRRANWLPLALIPGDALAVAISVLLAYWFRVHVAPLNGLSTEASHLGLYLAAIPVVVILFLVALAINQQYRSWRGRTLMELLFAMFSGVALAGMLTLAGMSLIGGSQYSRLIFVYLIVFCAILLTTERYVLRQVETRLRRQGIGAERVLMVGTGFGSELLISRMTMFPQYGYHICGVVDDQLDPGTVYAGSSILGAIEALPRLIRELRIDEVFLAVPGATREQLLHLIKTCEDQQVEFKIVPDLLEVMTTRVALDAIDGLPLIGVRRNRLRGSAAIMKRAMDIVVSAIGLIVASPLLLLMAVAIRLTSRGPVLFRQERVGLHGRTFVVYKFRTMIDNAEAETGPVVATKGDPRSTLVGRVLRRLSLDELPQLYNVLRGDMSLVGPRPMRPFLVERYRGEVPRYLERHQVRPGITGWAEVNDLRGAAPVADRAMYDIYYVENWSLVLDLKILVLTIVRLLFQQHAY
jgi:exopolysaccharide biosynthesis polyprenyl glycosylphosphotransferase